MYFDLGHVLWLLLIGLAGGYWWNAHAAREQAYEAARQHCQHLDLQLLDYNVYRSRLSLGRDSQGQLCLRRTYLFEFTSTGEQRYYGQVIMLGKQIGSIQLQPHRL